MAFISTITVPGTRVTIQDAYCRASLTLCDKNMSRVSVDVWNSLEDRLANPDAPSLPSPIVEVFRTDLELPCANAIDYAYKLLAASGVYPEAKWNQ